MSLLIQTYLVLIGTVLFGFLLMRAMYFNYLKRLKDKREQKTERIMFQVKVSRDNERGPLVMEQILATFHGLIKKLSWWDRLWGREQERMSLEISNIDNKILFHIWASRKYKNLVEGQMYAQYPDIEIQVIDDYARLQSDEITLKPEKSGRKLRKEQSLVTSEEAKSYHMLAGEQVDLYPTAAGAELCLENLDMFPIKRYGQFEDRIAQIQVDPLAGLTAALAQLNGKNEQAWLQIVMSPMDDSWRKISIKRLTIFKQLFARGIFRNSFYLQGLVAKLYTKEGFFRKVLFSPLFFLLYILRGGGKFSLLEREAGQQGPGGGESVSGEVEKKHDRESSESAAVAKITQLAFLTNIRFIYIPNSENQSLAEGKLQEMAGSFKQFNIPHSNGFTVRTLNRHNQHILKRFAKRSLLRPFVLSIEELATIYHFPNIHVQTPNIQWVNSRRLEPPTDLPNPQTVPPHDFTMLGETNFRGDHRKFGIKAIDRARHVYIIGKTGMGKSTLLENMIFSDIQNGKGVAVVDPHGDLADAVLNFVPSSRTNDVILFEPADRDFPVSFNMLECKNPEHRSLVASGLLGVFKKMYADSWGPRLEHILRNTIMALLEYPNSTMLGIMKMLVDANFRKKVVKKVENPLVRSFWLDEFAKMQERQRTEAISPIQNKVGQFLSSPVIRNILGQPKSAVDIRFAMDNKKIFVVNLSKGKIGEDNSSLLGSMMITKFQLDAMSRADIPEKDRTDFYLYVDEFQNFATDSFATILSEARKYKLNLTMANQYIAQMPEEVRDAVFGNVGTMISFQVGFDDADIFSKQFSEVATPNDIVQIPKYTAYIKLLVDGMPTKVFSMATLAPPEIEDDEGRREKIIKVSREKYGTDREVVEDKILRWTGMKQEEEKLPAAEQKEALPEQSKSQERPPNHPKPKHKTFVKKPPRPKNEG